MHCWIVVAKLRRLHVILVDVVLLLKIVVGQPLIVLAYSEDDLFERDFNNFFGSVVNDRDCDCVGYGEVVGISERLEGLNGSIIFLPVEADGPLHFVGGVD